MHHGRKHTVFEFDTVFEFGTAEDNFAVFLRFFNYRYCTFIQRRRVAIVLVAAEGNTRY